MSAADVTLYIGIASTLRDRRSGPPVSQDVEADILQALDAVWETLTAQNGRTLKSF